MVASSLGAPWGEDGGGGGCQCRLHPLSLVWCLCVCWVPWVRSLTLPRDEQSSLELEEMKGSHGSHAAPSSAPDELLNPLPDRQTDVLQPVPKPLGDPVSVRLRLALPPCRLKILLPHIG